MMHIKKGLIILAICLAGACTALPITPAPTLILETVTPTLEPSATNTPIPQNTATLTRFPTETATNTPTSTETASKTPIPTDTPTATATNSPTPTNTLTATLIPSRTLIPTVTPTRPPTLTPDVVEQSSDQLAFTTLPPLGYSHEWDCMRTFFDILVNATKWTITRRDMTGYFECIARIQGKG